MRFSIVGDSDLKDSTRILLILDGVDSFSTVYINNKTVGSTFNMFLKYHFDIKEHLLVIVDRLFQLF